MSGKIPILIVGSLPPPAIGPSLATQRLLQSPLLHEAFRVHFLDISDHRKPTNIGQADYGNIWLGLRHALTCWWLLLRHRPRVVYLPFSQGFWGYLRDLTFIIPAILLRRRLVLHLRGSEFGQFYRHEMPRWMQILSRWTFRHVDRVIVLGESLRTAMHDVVTDDRIVVIPNGINPADFDPPPDAAAPQRPPEQLLFLSSLRERKGLFLFLRALHELRRDNPAVRATIAGDWQDAAEKRRGMDLIRELNLESAVDFVGEVNGPEKVRLYRAHSIFVFPPTQPEGLPWVLLEAMSAGLPVVTTDQGAIREVVQDGSTGFIVPPEPVMLADRIAELIRDPNLRGSMGAAGRLRVLSHFSEASCISRLREVLLSVARPDGHAAPSTTPTTLTSA